MSRPLALACLLACGCVARGVSAEDDAGPAAVDAGDGSLTIPELRDPTSPGHAALGTPVVVRGAVVTDVRNVGNSHGFFAQDPNATSWAAIYVFVGPNVVEQSVGDVVRVSGTYSSYLGLDEIDARAGDVEVTGSRARPAAIDVTLADIEPNGNRPDALQSMLVRLTDVVALTDTTKLEFTLGQWDSSASVAVTSYMANDTGPSPFPVTTGEHFSSIVGHAYVDGVPKLAPMSASDLVVGE